MAGTFSKANRPRRPGAYFNFVAAQPEPQYSSAFDVVALPVTANWGPENRVVEVNDLQEYISIFGREQATTGYVAVEQAFRGEGTAGRPGAGRILVYRMVATAGAAATKSLQNTTPAAALTLTARYKGTYGGRLKVSVVTNAAGTRDLILYDDTVEIERYSYTATNITALAADINLNSDWVTATSVVSGTDLATVASPTAFSAGDSGTTLVANDYTAMRTALEPYRFGIFAPANLIDNTIITSLVAWSQSMNARGKRFVSVVGGAAGESIGPVASTTTALYRSATVINDPNFVNVGGGTYSDQRHGTLSSAQLAPRIAGIIASRGERSSFTFARLAGVTITTGLQISDVIDAIAGGVVAITRDSRADAPTRVEKAVTAFVSTSDANRPLTVYSSPKHVRVMHSLETEITEFSEWNIIGQMAVTDATRDYLLGYVRNVMSGKEASGVIQPGWGVQIDTDPPPAPEDEYIALAYSLRFGRSLEQVFNTVTVA